MLAASLLVAAPAHPRGLERLSAAPEDAAVSQGSTAQGTGPVAQPSVVGGGTTTINSFPHQVALVLDAARFGFLGDDLQRQFCGGTLITPRIVQTAAHCLIDTDPDDGSQMDTNDFDVVAGRTTLSVGGGQRLDVIDGVLDAFEPSTSLFDAAWLVLSAPAPAPASPVKIAGPGETALWAAGAKTRVTGWGTTSQGGPASDTLKVATVPIIPDASCDSLGGPYAAKFNPAVMLCAGFLSGGTDSCQGDSGGPLVAPGFLGSTRVARLVGVVSWGVGCASPNAPGVYTRIAGPGYNPAVQQAVDLLESDNGLPDAGTVYGKGATRKKKCRKGKRLRKGKCTKRKRKKGRKK